MKKEMKKGGRQLTAALFIIDCSLRCNRADFRERLADSDQ